MSKLRMICGSCGGDNVLCDAFANWNVETQAWELHSTYDKGSHCEDCEGECRIEEVPA
jgi:hypothetical protein